MWFSLGSNTYKVCENHSQIRGPFLLDRVPYNVHENDTYEKRY